MFASFIQLYMKYTTSKLKIYKNKNEKQHRFLPLDVAKQDRKKDVDNQNNIKQLTCSQINVSIYVNFLESLSNDKININKIYMVQQA